MNLLMEITKDILHYRIKIFNNDQFSGAHPRETNNLFIVILILELRVGKSCSVSGTGLADHS